MIKLRSSIFTLIVLLTPCISPANEELTIQERLKRYMGSLSENTEQKTDEKCLTCSNVARNIPDAIPSLLVFASFSMPDGVWLSISEDLNKIGGTFVIRGIPLNNFKELARQIYNLRQKGVNADIQLNPKLFDEYEINTVPAFVVQDGKIWDKISGTISVEYALNEIQRKGDGKIATSLLDNLRRSDP